MQCQKHTAAPNKQSDENTLTLATSCIIIHTHFGGNGMRAVCLNAYVCVCRHPISFIWNVLFFFFISYFGERMEHKSLEMMILMTNSCDYKEGRRTCTHQKPCTQLQSAASFQVNFVLVQMVYVWTERWIYIPHHGSLIQQQKPIFLCLCCRCCCLRCCFFSHSFSIEIYIHDKKRVNSRSAYREKREKKALQRTYLFVMCDGICGRLLALWMYNTREREHERGREIDKHASHCIIASCYDCCCCCCYYYCCSRPP